MPDVRVVMNEQAIRDLFYEWGGDNPVAEALGATGDVVLARAIAGAPVSRRGSKYAPPGFLRSKLVAEDGHSDDGEIAVYVGTHTNRRGGANPYPFAFIYNADGTTLNATRIAGVYHSYGYRPADNDFLGDSLDGVYEVFGEAGD